MKNAPECPFPLSLFLEEERLKYTCALKLCTLGCTASKYKQPESEALKPFAPVTCLKAYNHKAAKTRNTNLQSLNRSLENILVQLSDFGQTCEYIPRVSLLTLATSPKLNKSLQQVSRKVKSVHVCSPDCRGG